MKTLPPEQNADLADGLRQTPPFSESVLAEARRLVKEFSGRFWFRHPEATVETYEDVLLVVRHLREYGGHRAWYAAQKIWKCL